MKNIVKRLFTVLPGPLRDRLRSFLNQRNWVTRFRGQHEKYFNEYETRSFLVDLLKQHVSGVDELAIFEFGCSGGNNLRLLRERLGRPIRFVGVDLSPDAITFAKETFPDDAFHVGDGSAAISLLEGGSHDVFLASGVLSYLPESGCRDVLRAASKSCRILLLCDQLDHMDAQQGLEDGIYHHPFRRLFAESGWEIVGDVEPSRTGHIYSSLVARTTALHNPENPATA